ncbi:cell division cycle-associated protein 2 [Trematomus bernacchii]|uniref:cell division cycle-associated protein 2 n=1 Tax=Trematomus bernacchii TaxID=40690 RepID=UPI00146DC86C|nr:cell division cycle-associated protein 2 [Trematomus bernacchii]
MATLENNTASTDGDQKENMLTPSKLDSHPVLNDTTAPMMFSNLTPSQFGISVHSFTPTSLPNHKDKSRLAQMKARRRSSVGVRGSPETNSLIRFIAQQRMKTPLGSRTPEPVRSGPLLPRVNATLRQKMASFQSLMDMEESVICDPVPKQDSNTGGCIKTRDYLSDGNSPYEGKENHHPVTPPSKSRCLGPLQGCGMEFREAHTLPFSLKEQEEKEETGTLTPSETVHEAHALLVSQNLHDDFEILACSHAKNQQDGVFELQSSGQTPPDEASAASPSLPFSPFSLPSLQEMKPPGEDAFKTKKKSVRFGCPLSPEFFDKALPPSTPLKKGSTPARAPTPRWSLHPRSVLKTPQRIESQTPQTQRDLSSPTDFGASPTLAIPRNRRVPSVEEDPQEEEEGGKIVFPSMEDIDAEVTEDTERTWDQQPLTLDTAFHEECLSNSLTEIEASLCTPSLTDAGDEPSSLPEEEKQPEAEPEAPTKSRKQRKKQPAADPAAGSEAPCRSTKRKRKQPEEMVPAMRPTRSAAKSAVGKMKVATRRRWSRDVDRSRYGLRVYVCKKPNLSPIAEKPSPPRLTLTTQRERSSGPKKMKVSCADDFLLINQTEGTTEELREVEHTTNHEVSRETPVPEEEVDAEQNLHTLAQTPCTDSEGKLENHGSVDAPNSGGGSHKTLAVQRKTSRGRRSSRNICVKMEQAEPLQTLPDEEAPEQEDNIRSSSDSQEEGAVAPLDLAPWEDYVYFEDVFKPVASRGRRSVRRSMRNQRGVKQDSSAGGMAWVPHTSPESLKESRRKNRGHGLRVPPLTPPLRNLRSLKNAHQN